MPVHPSEEEAPSGIFEKVAKDPSSTTESTASDHGMINRSDSSSPTAATTRILGRTRINIALYEVTRPTPKPRLIPNLVEHHENEHTPGKASAQDHQSKGPAIPMNISGTSLAYYCERGHGG